jgi:hypothetical protein
MYRLAIRFLCFSHPRRPALLLAHSFMHISNKAKLPNFTSNQAFKNRLHLKNPSPPVLPKNTKTGKTDRFFYIKFNFWNLGKENRVIFQFIARFFWFIGRFS